jgi:hypothetical protein
MSDLPLGKVIITPQEKDAIHIAVAPVEAAHNLSPGARVQLAPDGRAVQGSKPIGIVDPVLELPVSAGEKFWLFLFPGTITALRHDWTHPAFTQIPCCREDNLATGAHVKTPQQSSAELWLRKFADDNLAHFEELIAEARTAGEFCFGSDTPYDEIDEFWRQLEIFTGQQFGLDHRERTSFRCAC